MELPATPRSFYPARFISFLLRWYFQIHTLLFEGLAYEHRSRRLCFGKLERSAGRNYVTSVLASAGTHIYYVVSRTYNIEIMLNHKDGITLVDKTVQHIEKHAYVVEMQPGRWFVKNEKSVSRVAS